MCSHVVHYFNSCLILKASQMNMKCSLILKLTLYDFKLDHNCNQKHLLSKKWRFSWSQERNQMGTRNSAQVVRTSRIRQGQVGLKPWILRPCSKTEKQIQRVAFRAQVSLASHSPGWFVTFTTWWKHLELINSAVCYQNIWLVSLFNGISTFVGYLMSKPFF